MRWRADTQTDTQTRVTTGREHGYRPSPTCVDHPQPVDGSLHRLRHGLEERDAEDAAGAEHERLERGVVDEQRPLDDDVASVERLHEPDTHDSDVARRASTRLDEERPLTVHVAEVCTQGEMTSRICGRSTIAIL